MAQLSPNAHLVGVPGGRWRLNTPALVLRSRRDGKEHHGDGRALPARRTGAAPARQKPQISRYRAGAESPPAPRASAAPPCARAEVLTDAGVSGILITSPPTGAAKIARLMALRARAPDLMVASDTAAHLDALASAARDASAAPPLRVVVDFDVGTRRTGARDAEIGRRAGASNGGGGRASNSPDYKPIMAICSTLPASTNAAKR